MYAVVALALGQSVRDVCHDPYDIVSELAVAMHQTTLRFSPDVWAALEEEAGRLGVSTAQYIREAAVARLAYGLGRRGDRGLEGAVRGAGSSSSEAEWGPHASWDAPNSGAVWAQGDIAGERARELRSRHTKRRRRRPPRPRTEN